MNESILNATKNLGLLLQESEEFTAMQKQEGDALADQELQGLYREYSLARQNMQQEEMENEPDQKAIDALRTDIGRMEEQLSENPTMASLNKSRNSFNRLMQQVNAVLEETLNPKEDGDDLEQGGCGSGGCAGCSGCGSER